MIDIEAIRARLEAVNKQWNTYYGKKAQTLFRACLSDIPDLITENERLKDKNSALRNELCLKCGRYREAHNGACNFCKWRNKE